MRRAKAKPRAKAKRTIVHTRRDLAQAVGRTDRQTIHYTQRGMPGNFRDGWCVEECLAWVSENIKPTGRESAPSGPQPGLPGSRGFWETYHAREKALLAELERRKLARELIEVDLVARLSARRITHAKALLEQIPDRLLGLLPRTFSAAAKKDFRRRGMGMIDDALFALADAAEDGYGVDEDAQADAPGGAPNPTSAGTGLVA